MAEAHLSGLFAEMSQESRWTTALTSGGGGGGDQQKFEHIEGNEEGSNVESFVLRMGHLISQLPPKFTVDTGSIRASIGRLTAEQYSTSFSILQDLVLVQPVRKPPKEHLPSPKPDQDRYQKARVECPRGKASEQGIEP